MEQEKKEKRRNCSIDCLRFLYAWVVACFHYYTGYANGDVQHFLSGNTSVEFFLIAAAVFFFMSFEREEQKCTRGGGHLSVIYALP